MYLFIKDKKEELLDGRTIKYLSQKIGVARETLNEILNGNRKTKKVTAFCIVKSCNADKEIEDYFINI